MADFQKPKDPNWICTFSLRRNPDKKPGDKRPDFVLVDSEKKNEKTGKKMSRHLSRKGTFFSCFFGFFKTEKTRLEKPKKT